MEPKPTYRPRDPRHVMQDLTIAVYMDAWAASQRNPAQTVEILEVAREMLQRVKDPNEAPQELLPRAAEIDRLASRSWKRKDHRHHEDSRFDDYEVVDLLEGR